jgi:hypothetical protein
MLIIGLLLLAGACVVGVTGVLSNRGTGHEVTGGFDAFGRTMHGSSGQLFFWGIVVGGVAMLGLLLLLVGLRGDIRRRNVARQVAVQNRNGEHEAIPAEEHAQGPAETGRTPAESTPSPHVAEQASADSDPAAQNAE